MFSIFHSPGQPERPRRVLATLTGTTSLNHPTAAYREALLTDIDEALLPYTLEHLMIRNHGDTKRSSADFD